MSFACKPKEALVISVLINSKANNSLLKHFSFGNQFLLSLFFLLASHIMTVAIITITQILTVLMTSTNDKIHRIRRKKHQTEQQTDGRTKWRNDGVVQHEPFATGLFWFDNSKASRMHSSIDISVRSITNRFMPSIYRCNEQNVCLISLGAVVWCLCLNWWQFRFVHQPIHTHTHNR